MSFFRALFDFSFSEFITSKIIKLLYVIVLILQALAWLFFLVTTIGQGGLSIVLALIGAPIGFLLSVIFTRVGMEILMVVFGIAEHVRDMSWAMTGGRKAPTGGQPHMPAPQPQYAPPPQQYAAPQPPPQAPRPQPQYPQYPQQPPQPPPQPPQYPQYPPQQPPPQYPPKP